MTSGDCRLDLIRRSLRLLLVFGYLLVLGCRDTTDVSGPQVLAAQPVDGERPISVGVFYVTNRQRDQQASAADAYRGNRGETHFGRCEVEFAPIPILNQVAPRIPFYVPDESKKVVVAEQKAASEFWELLVNSVSQNATQSIVVFVHGYSNSFIRTCRMAAEIQRVLADQATLLMFSWPSNGRPTDYVSDQADLEWSVPLLTDLLAKIGELVGTSKVQLLAHSLGSRGVIFALQRLSTERVSRPLIGRLVFLAPDFDSQTFAELLPRLVPLAGDITLYASSNDAPLRVSQQLHGYPRLGQAGEHLTVVKGMETIDVSPAGRYQILGHEYFFYHPQVAADLAKHITTGARAADRPGLRPRERNGITYWEVLPNSADHDHLPAGSRALQGLERVMTTDLAGVDQLSLVNELTLLVTDCGRRTVYRH